MSEEYYHLNFGNYFKAVWRQKWIVVLCVCIFIGVSLIAIKNRVPVYQARLSFWIRETKGVGQEVVAEKMMRMFFIGQRESLEATFGTQLEIIKSSLILEKVVKELGLPSETKEILNDSIRFIRRCISVSKITNTSMVEIKAFHTSPEMAIKIVNGVYNAYIEFDNRLFLEEEEKKLKSTEGQARLLREEMGKSSDLISERIKGDMYLLLMNNIAESRLNLVLGKSERVKVIDRADTADRVANMRGSLLLFLMGMMGLFLGTMLALGIDALKHRKDA